MGKIRKLHKKIIEITLLGAMIMILTSVLTVFADEENTGTIVLTKKVYRELGLPTSGDIVIPDTITYNGEKYTVSGIGPFLFRFNNNIRSVVLPDTLRKIEAFAFDCCENLEHCQLPEGLTQIGYAAFQCCYNLKELEIPGSVISIGNFAYNHCSSLGNDEIHIPAALKCLGNDPSYPAHMFYDCGRKDRFTSYTVDPRNQIYCEEDGILYTKGKETLVAIPVGKKFPDQTYVMPDTVKNLGELAFSRNPNIKTVVISDSLEVDGAMEEEEKSAYLNYGNDLSVSCYIYNKVEQYVAKESNVNYTSVNGVLYSKDKKHLVAVPNQYRGVLDIPEGTETWDKEAIWTELDSFDGLAFSNVPKVCVPSTMHEIHKEQIDALNRLKDTTGLSISVSRENPIFAVDGQGYLVIKIPNA